MFSRKEISFFNDPYFRVIRQEEQFVEVQSLNTKHCWNIFKNQFDGLVGYSPIAMAKNAIGLAIAAEEYGSKFYANGAAPSGVLEHPGTLKDLGRVRDSWNAAFGGISSCWTYRLFQRKISCAHQQAGDKGRWKSRFSTIRSIGQDSEQSRNKNLIKTQKISKKKREV